MAKVGNPYHDPDTGEFTSGPSGRHDVATEIRRHEASRIVSGGVGAVAGLSAAYVAATFATAGTALPVGLGVGGAIYLADRIADIHRHLKEQHEYDSGKLLKK